MKLNEKIKLLETVKSEVLGDYDMGSDLDSMGINYKGFLATLDLFREKNGDLAAINYLKGFVRRIRADQRSEQRKTLDLLRSIFKEPL